MKAGWQMKKVGDVCDILDYKRRPITKKDRIAGPYPYYGATGVLDYVHDFIFDETLILLGEDGAKWGAGENSAFVAVGKYWVNNHAHALRPIRNIIEDKWLVYYLNFTNLIPYVTGLTVPKLNQEKMRSIAIPIPPLEEQQRIVSILNQAIAAIAKAKENAEKNLQNAKELFEMSLQKAFFEQTDSEKKPLGDLGIITSSKRIFKSEYVSNGIPFYRTKEIKQLANGKLITTELFISNEKYLDIKRSFGIPSKGDILLTAIGTIGEMHVVNDDKEFYFKDGNVLWLKDFKHMDPYYLKYALSSLIEQVKKLAHGAAYNALPIEKIKAYKIPVTSINEQKALVDKLDLLFIKTKNLEAVYNQKLSNLEELKKTILQKAFAGELTQKEIPEMI